MKWGVIYTKSLYLGLYVYSIVFLHKSRLVVSERSTFFSILLCMSPTRSRYKDLGLDLVEPLQDQTRKPRWTAIGDEKKDEGAGDPIKILLEEAL